MNLILISLFPFFGVAYLLPEATLLHVVLLSICLCIIRENDGVVSLLTFALLSKERTGPNLPKQRSPKTTLQIACNIFSFLRLWLLLQFLTACCDVSDILATMSRYLHWRISESVNEDCGGVAWQPSFNLTDSITGFHAR